MNRQVSYYGPLPYSPLPCNIPGPRPSSLINHPLPPKPPISMYFHAYTPPARKPVTALCDMAAQHVDHGQSSPVNNEPKGPYATASLVGVWRSLDMESAIYPSSEDTSPRPENDEFGATGSINGDDFPHPDTSWDSDTRSCEPSTAPRCADDGPCHDKLSATASEVHGTGSWSCETFVGDTADVDKYGIGPTKPFTNGSKGGLSDTLVSKTLPASGLMVVEGSQPSLPVCASAEPVAETTMCSTSRISQLNHRNQKKPACTVFRYTEVAVPGGPRTRARARAEAFCSLSSRRRARQFSNAEDELLRELAGKRLAWEQIEEEFGQKFVGRDLKSLQGRWSRKLKFLARPAKQLPAGLGRRFPS
ncbi:hypothetical protein BJX99DRAFT_88769 [Aspergillus californicus]